MAGILLFVVVLAGVGVVLPATISAAYGHFSTRNKTALTAARADARLAQQSLNEAENALRAIRHRSEDSLSIQEADLALDIIEANRHKEISS